MLLLLSAACSRDALTVTAGSGFRRTWGWAAGEKREGVEKERELMDSIFEFAEKIGDFDWVFIGIIFYLNGGKLWRGKS